MQAYRSPWWLKGPEPWGGHVQTIWPALFSRGPAVPASYQRERWNTPDGDFIDVDFLPWVAGQADRSDRSVGVRPLLVLFHGLEGSSSSHYARAFAHWAHAQGWDYAVPHFRGCSGELNRAPRTYHSGDFVEIDWILRRLAALQAGPVLAMGVSLGGNALLRWAQEAGGQASAVVRAVAAVSSPVDLAAAGHAIGRGFNRHCYNRLFLNSLKPKALGKLVQFPGLFDASALRASRDLYAFDQAFTAPVHGFASTEAYWQRCSAGARLHEITGLPALVVNALNDPFVPSASLPRQDEVGGWVTLWQPEHGGHVGFAAGRWPGQLVALPTAVGSWMAQQLGTGGSHG